MNIISIKQQNKANQKQQNIEEQTQKKEKNGTQINTIMSSTIRVMNNFKQRHNTLSFKLSNLTFVHGELF